MDTKIKVSAKAQNRLALGVLRAYVIMNPEVTLDEISATFPHSINPDSGVKENFIDVLKVHEKQGENWNGYFVKDQEVIALHNGTKMAVVSMWTKPSLDRLLKKAAEFGIEAEKMDQLPEQVDELPDVSEAVPSKSVGYVLEFVNGYKPEPPRSELLLSVEEDIKDFFSQFEAHPSEQGKHIFFNEKDFQIRLSIYLTGLKNGDGTPKYDDVDVEYYLPQKEMGLEYIEIWKNKMFLDIVVEKDGVFVPVELKYSTDTVSMEITRFGEVIKDEDIIKHQGATNLVCYNFWKDVKRLELVKKRFPKVKNGIALILTNNASFKNTPNENAGYAPFSLADGRHDSKKYWGDSIAEKIKEGYPDFDLNKSYTTNWHDITLDGESFFYNLVEI